MSRLRGILLRLHGLAPSQQREQDFNAELDSHLQMHTDDNLRAGMSTAEARRQAILTLGGVEHTRQSYRDQSTLPLLENLLQDVRFALRQLRKNLGFTLTAVLMLALGTGASVAIFAFVDAALVKPLPYSDPTRLVGVFESISLGPHFNISYPDYLDWKRENTVFTSLEVFQGTGFILTEHSGPSAIRGARVSDGFFSTLGVKPILGRAFAPGEDLPSAPRTVLLTYSAWQRRFNGRPDVLGQTLTIDRQPNTIIGVLPRDFLFAAVGTPEIYVTLHAADSCALRRSCHNLLGIARLKPGVSFNNAESNVIAVAAQLQKLYPQSNRGQSASLLPFAQYLTGDVKPILLLLLAGAALLLLIACINVANLLLVRTENRRREMALRSALGASRARITCQFMTEALVLVVVGTGLGLGLAAGAMRLLMALIPTRMLNGMPYLAGLGLNPRVLLFTGAVALGALVIFSATPALRLSQSHIQQGLSEGGRGSAGTTWRRFGSGLVVLELATAMILLVGAGLLSKSFYRLLHVDLGLQPDHLAVLFIAAPEDPYGKDPAAVALVQRILDRANALPGVRSAAITSGVPMSNSSNTEWVRIMGRPWHEGEHLEMVYREITPAYFTTLGSTLSRGRFFTNADTGDKPHVAIINQAFAHTYFPGEDPLGHQLAHTSSPNEPPIQIVGIVDDVREGSLEEPNAPILYFPFAQSTETYLGLLVRTTQPERSILPTLVAAVHGVDPDLVLEDPGTFSDLIANSPSAYLHRSVAWLVGAFAVLALLLGVIGLYGVVAYSVSQRTREIGVRMALGAQRATVYRLILGEAGTLAAIGIVTGLGVSVAAAMLIRKLLFGVQAWDIPTLLSVALVLGASALFGSFLPARRAASINPTEALRAE